MDAAQEKKAAEDKLRHAAEFRKKHGISDKEWELALAHEKDIQRKAYDWFWELWEKDKNVQ